VRAIGFSSTMLRAVQVVVGDGMPDGPQKIRTKP
jgi:hypothetical protein